jgi:hypothetical protein
LRKFKIPRNHPVLEAAKQLLGFVLADLDLSDIRPGHGPGGVADKKDRFERWDINEWPKKALRVYPFYQFAVPSFEALCERSNFRVVENPTTRICLVPKDFKAPRLISAESTVTQYLQQGQMRKMMQYIQSNTLLYRSVRLRDQSHNRFMAQKAYSDHSATVDLSNASDTISVPLFWYLFSELPVLRRQLMSTRSDFAQAGEERIRLSAFAPMGSAVCFPVETLVFWAICMASVRLHRVIHRTEMRFMSWWDISSQVSVFGDDIVMPLDGCLETFLTTLQSVGCQPNMSKTCYKTPFRESCGKEYFNGNDVSIIRNRNYHYDERKKIADYPVLLDLQRKFFSFGLFRTAALLRDWAREIYPIIEYFPRESELESFRQNLELYRSDFAGDLTFRRDHDRFCCAFSSRCHIDSGIKTRFNRDYQRHECRLPIVVQRYRKWESEGYPRLLARLLSDRVERVPARDSNVRTGWTYLPAYMGLEALILC